MKKVMVVLVALVMMASVFTGPSEAAQRYQKSDLTAMFLSAFMPGVGEWYNADFEGSFPLIECIAGAICPCVSISSLIDATAGDASNGKMRIDFWSGVNVE